ncbi:hypothetical protein PR001_g7341 [Phytophthora rubi]|uniref:Uncharacterized protein n=1 Tax=Phytophthora rubi TaxID=129364 RepID=A0A6A3N8A8_9STRA|nr:hypothetical protein PR001_g7341 [Phytophthora rubi]
MDQALKPWDLYDLSGAESPESLVTMQDYVRSFRVLRVKGVEGVAQASHQRSWCAMIVRWNRMLRANASFVERLPGREGVVGNYSQRDRRARVCTNVWDAATSKCVKAAPSVAARETSPRRTGSAKSLSSRSAKWSNLEWPSTGVRLPTSQCLPAAAGAAALILGGALIRRRVVILVLGRARSATVASSYSRRTSGTSRRRVECGSHVSSSGATPSHRTW